MVLDHLNDDGQHHSITYASRQTNDAEKKYVLTELEVVALKCIFSEDRVDHEALVRCS